MKTIILNTLFGKISLNLSEADPADGSRSGIVAGSELSQASDPDQAVEVLERLVLAHACAGVDVESAAYVQGLETVLEALDNRG